MEKKKTGFCIGKFDLLHLGHLSYIKFAKSQCDYLYVGVVGNSFHGYKKKTLVFSLEERKEIIEALKWVDEVITFENEGELHHWLEEIKPEVLVAGQEYLKNQPLTPFFKKENIVYDLNPKMMDSSSVMSSTQLKRIIKEELHI